MIIALLQVIITVLILLWVLKKKTGEPYSKKSVVKFVGFGMIAVVLVLGVSLMLPDKKNLFININPLLGGFLAAFLTAALSEELAKYVLFRLAVRKNAEMVCWLDAIIAAVAVGVGFTILENLEFSISGDISILRVLLPGHLLFQWIMGYYYGKARVTGQAKYHVLSLVVPVAVHTVFDMFIIAMQFVIGGDRSVLSDEAALHALPHYGYMIPLAACVIVTMVVSLVALILMFRKIAVWSKNGGKQELLSGKDA